MRGAADNGANEAAATAGGLGGVGGAGGLDARCGVDGLETLRSGEGGAFGLDAAGFGLDAMAADGARIGCTGEERLL